MNKKGFTLVELLVVMTIIALLIAIAIPSGLTISKKIKRNMMDSKIEFIERGAVVWGQKNKKNIYEYPYNSEVPYGSKCIKAIEDSNVDSCIRKTVNDMLNTEKAFNEDKISSYDNSKLLINPTTNESINDCYVEIYIKNKRVFAKYDTDNQINANGENIICKY